MIITWIVGGVVIGLVIGYILWASGKKEAAVEVEKDSERDQRLKQLEQKIEAMSNNDLLTNNEVEQLLGVSDASAERYLDELEQKGLLEQVGKVGTMVNYKKVMK